MFNSVALKSIMEFYVQCFIYFLRIDMFTTAVRVLPADWCFPLGNTEKLQKAIWPMLILIWFLTPNTVSLPKLVYFKYINWLCLFSNSCKQFRFISIGHGFIEICLKLGFWWHFTRVRIRLCSPSEEKVYLTTFKHFRLLQSRALENNFAQTYLSK